MALVGNLRDFALHDFLYLVAHGHKSGSLRLHTAANAATLYFDQGKLISVVRPRRYERLGEMLLRLGKISPAQLQQALAAQKASVNGLLGTILVEQGHIAEAELQACVRMVIEHTVYDLFTWQEGAFEWRAGIRPGPDEIQTPVPLVVENLIMEGVRRVDEMTRIRQRIPSDDMIVRFTEQAKNSTSEVNLTPDEWRIFARINNHWSIAEIAEKLDLSAFEVGSVVFGLIVYGLVEVVNRENI